MTTKDIHLNLIKRYFRLRLVPIKTKINQRLLFQQSTEITYKLTLLTILKFLAILALLAVLTLLAILALLTILTIAAILVLLTMLTLRY